MNSVPTDYLLPGGGASITALPKVSLHDHLDGGLRPQTIIELAESHDLELPETDAAALGEWFAEKSDSGSLVEYLKTFDITTGVMQTQEGLARVAREFVQDLADDGVVYGEIRWAPEQHLTRGLTLDETVEAVQEGLDAGVDDVRSSGRRIRVGQLVSAMRHNTRGLEIAELAVRHRGNGVVGFDIAGAEAGWPPSRHLDAFQYVHRENFHVTIHAGEGYGLPSIWEAVQYCGAERLGHGVRLAEDIQVKDGGPVTLGRLASYIRDRRIPLEMCPTSNV